MYTASTAFLEALQEAGVSYIFANFGSDHPGLMEALAEGAAQGRGYPRVITCPSEMVALSCAQGYAQVSGRAQAVVVHVECGTQSLGGAVHNAAKGRAPVLIYAGLSPATQDGELKGSRNEFIQWIQDVSDQRGILRGYVKYDNEFRTSRNVKQLVHRALQIAQSEPCGPVYLVGAREVMEEPCEPCALDPARWSALGPVAVPEEALARIVAALSAARRPLIVTSYVGRDPAAVGELVRLCHTLGIGVLESVPNFANYPHDDPFYQGNQWNHPFQNPLLAQADVVLVLDSDVPWIPTVSKPSAAATIFHLDTDPLKESTPLWYIGAHESYRASARLALRQMNACLEAHPPEAAGCRERRAHFERLHAERVAALAAAEQPRAGAITPEYLTARIRAHLDGPTIILSEGVTNYPAICDHIGPVPAGSYFNSGGGSLGWNGGAAIGAKLARPDSTVVALTGDGSYLFSVPSSVHWIARRYHTPFLQVVYNNGGWKAPRFSALSVHPDGYASRAEDLSLSFSPAPDYAGIAAAAGGAFARQVRDPAQLDGALAEAFEAVRHGGRAAVLDVIVSD